MTRTSARLTVALVAAGSLAVLSSPVAAQEDRDCADFPSQAAAQAALLADPSDPERLDQNNNGQACEDFDYGPVAGAPSPLPDAPSDDAPDSDEDSGGAGGDGGAGSAESTPASAELRRSPSRWPRWPPSRSGACWSPVAWS